MAIPVEITALGRPEARIVWDDESEDVWGARELRLRCVCAHCQSEATGERLLDPKTVPEDITIKEMSFVGNYGLSIHFSDGHTTGIYRHKDLKRTK